MLPLARARPLWALGLCFGASVVAGCTAGDDMRPRPALWAEACVLSYADLRDDPDSRKVQLEMCTADYASYPRAIANRAATCVVNLVAKHRPEVPPDASMIECMGDRANAYFAKRAAALEALAGYSDALIAYNAEHSEGAKSFADAGLTPVAGPWGELPTMTFNGPGNWDLCDPGPDREAKSHDDVCAAPPFIFFQF